MEIKETNLDAFGAPVELPKKSYAEEEAEIGKMLDEKAKADTPAPVPVVVVPAVDPAKPVAPAALSETDPIVVALKQQIEDVKSTYGGNIAGQKAVIDRLNDEIRDLKGGKKIDEAKIEPLYKVERVKDMSAEDQAALSPVEKKLIEELADTREQMNKTHEATQRKAIEQQVKAENNTEATNQNLERNSQVEASSLAKGNVEMANKILAEFNQFRDNDKLDDAGIKARMAKAAALVPEYKAPKEQAAAPHGKVAATDSKSDDPFGNKAIVESAAKGAQRGNFSL